MQFTSWQTIETAIGKHNDLCKKVNINFDKLPLISTKSIENAIHELEVSPVDFDTTMKDLKHYRALLSRTKELNKGIVKKNVGRNSMKEISAYSMKIAFDLVEKYGSLDLAFELSHIKKSSYYTARKDFKYLGFSTTSAIECDDIHVDATFSTYFKRLNGNSVNVHKPKYDIYFRNVLPKYKKMF